MELEVEASVNGCVVGASWLRRCPQRAVLESMVPRLRQVGSAERPMMRATCCAHMVSAQNVLALPAPRPHKSKLPEQKPGLRLASERREHVRHRCVTLTTARLRCVTTDSDHSNPGRTVHQQALHEGRVGIINPAERSEPRACK